MLRYELIIIDDEATGDNVLDHVITDDADKVIEVVKGRDYEQGAKLGGRDESR